MAYTATDLRMMLERTGGANHTVDGSTLFCRVKSQPTVPDGLGRVQVERCELAHVSGDTFARTTRHDVELDGVVWRIAGVRDKLSGLVAWTLEREVG
jgi:hypothetical protein